jgi:hypothetical protein
VLNRQHRCCRLEVGVAVNNGVLVRCGNAVSKSAMQTALSWPIRANSRAANAAEARDRTPVIGPGDQSPHRALRRGWACRRIAY